MLLTPIVSQPEVEFHWLKVGHCRQRERLAVRGGSWSRIDFPSLVGLIGHRDHGWTLFDTGYSRHFFTATARYPERAYRTFLPVTLTPNEELLTQLDMLGIAADQIGRIIVSHFHGDHVAGLRDFPHASIVCHRSGLHQLRSVRRWEGARHGLLPALLPDDVSDRLIPVESLRRIELEGVDEQLVAVDLTGDMAIVLIDLPGHLPGHLGALITHLGEQLLLCGDAAWSHRAIVDRALPPPIVMGLFDDAGQTESTLSALHRLDHRVRILPSHCSASWRQWQTDHGGSPGGS